MTTAFTRLMPAPARAATLGALLLLGPSAAHAEFQVQESVVEKGEVELEYRGGFHWGLPDDEEAVRRSHEFEAQIGITDRWLLQVGGELTQLRDDDNLDGESVEIETILELLERKGDGFGLSFQVGYSSALRPEQANSVSFGPIAEFKSGRFLTTVNTFFSDPVGSFASGGIGLEYASRIGYDINKRLAIGVEAFGEIEDLSNAGSFEDQDHSIGPVVLIRLGGVDDNEEPASGAGPGGDDDNEKAGREAADAPTYSLALGVQFGLTDATSDAALRFGASVEF